MRYYTQEQRPDHRPCRYVTRSCVLKATGAIAAVTISINMKCPFQDLLTIHNLAPYAARTGTSKADVPERAEGAAACRTGALRSPTAGRPAGAAQIGRSAEV